jgi:hypothetical protein
MVMGLSSSEDFGSGDSAGAEGLCDQGVKGSRALNGRSKNEWFRIWREKFLREIKTSSRHHLK